MITFLICFSALVIVNIVFFLVVKFYGENKAVLKRSTPPRPAGKVVVLKKDLTLKYKQW